ncbi:hypothetical protein GCM10011575_15170 [Microlunatus endophyticus]|uniref:Sulfotransferase family protein n=1 Tax=Microlunatus endophyticus TaxID=1716077 RepID=A0A917W330_9ACTN|nr:hypothetical protein [Microlunatus endophyticus]GGL57743.1 hypothetical protein GCM10011575_15170 [Microlunatus endophyticus]
MPEPTATADTDQQTSEPRPTNGPVGDAGDPTGRRGRHQSLLMVTGPGRSGTSAVTGALNQLGIHVPPVLVKPNRSNNRGFFETRWVVDFQRKVLEKAHTYEFDADPQAVERMAKADSQRNREQLTNWLRSAVRGHQQVVIKDPRSVWLDDLWAGAADTIGLTISFLTMLRHPAEVVGSRQTYYASTDDERKARDYAISKVAGWINVSLINERQTRGRSRVFLRYTDLLDDWRTALGGIRDRLGLEFNASLDPGTPSPIDDFISPELHRIRTGWDDLGVPEPLRELADEVWAACERLADDGESAELEAVFDALSRRYERLYRDAAAITIDTTASAVSRAVARVTRSLQQQQTRDSAKSPSIGRAVALGRRAARRVRRRIGR